MAYVLSQHASGTLNSVDVDEALALDGVVGYVGAEDVPGSLFIGFARKTPIFAKDTVSIFGVFESCFNFKHFCSLFKSNVVVFINTSSFRFCITDNRLAVLWR